MHAYCLLAASLLSAFPAVASDQIDPRELAARSQTNAPLVVVDVRTPAEFAAGHIPGALLIPHDQVVAKLGQLEGAHELVLYCRSGRRARLAGAALSARGFDVHYLDGDYPGWLAAGLPIESTPSAPLPEAPSS